MKAASIVHLPATSLTVVTAEALHHCFRPSPPEVVVRRKAGHAVRPYAADTADILADKRVQLVALTRFLLNRPRVRIEARRSCREASDG